MTLDNCSVGDIVVSRRKSMLRDELYRLISNGHNNYIIEENELLLVLEIENKFCVKVLDRYGNIGWIARDSIDTFKCN